jgi:carbamoyltransferase
MNILGLSVFSDSSAAIIKDGIITSAVEEERLNRIKHYDGMPWLAIKECIDISGIDYREIDKIAIGWNPYKGWINRIGKSLFSVKNGITDLKTKTARGSGYILRCKDLFFLSREIKKKYSFYFDRKNIVYVNHHLAHAASSYFSSGFSSSNIIVADGVGESETISFFKASGNHIEKIKSIYYPNSLGHLYASITGYLGYKVTCDEGKVMALASFGEDKYKSFFDELVKINEKNGKLYLDNGILDYHLARNGIFKKRFTEILGFPQREKDEPINNNHYNLAHSLQSCIERAMIKLIRYYFPDGSGKPLCSSGGLFLNSVLNGKLIKEFTRDYFIFPACGDNGVSTGAALYIDAKINNKFKRRTLKNAYLGREHKIRIDELQANNKNIRYELSDDIISDTVKLINEGHIVGWYKGRMEFGPRALGNRSIFASPMIDGIKDKVNNKVKHRENYRPFACALLEEELEKLFENATTSPYMLKVYNFKDKYINAFPSINHIDNTCRVQTVNKQNNEVLYDILVKMKETSGYGMILNTSMNDAGEPIVNTPQEAIKLLSNTELDYMVIENYILQKNN